MAEEQGTPVSQDPVQQPAEPAPQAPPAPPAPSQQGAAPWTADLQSRFDPQTAAAVDAYLRQTWQPRVTQLEQQYAETEAARQFAGMWESDPHAANVAVNRQLYGDGYADQLAASLGRNDLVVNQQPAQQPAVQYQQPQEVQAATDPRYEEMFNDWSERRAQEQYDAAKADFLSDPQYADIDPDLFDGFVANADTWEGTVSAYRNYAAAWADRFAPQETQQQMAPPTIGSDAGGTPGSTPAVPRESLDAAIDAIFNENKPIAPPVMGQ